MPLKLIMPPSAEPVTLEEAKAHLIVEDSDDDAMIKSQIIAARRHAEHITGRALMPQVWELGLDGFGGEISLQKAPLLAIQSVQYVDASGAFQTLADADYQLDDFQEPGRLVPAYGMCWPSTRRQPNAVRIRFRCGYANAAAVPEEVKSWILLRVGMLYENRESVAAGAQLSELPHVDRLLDAAKLWGV